MTGISIFVNIMACAMAFSLRKDMLNPLFLFSFLWSVTLVLLVMTSSAYYPISIATEFVFVVGTAGFMVGYLFSEYLFLGKSAVLSSSAPTRPPTILSRRAMWLTLIVLIIGWFEYYRQVSALTSGTGLFVAFQEARYALVQASLSGEKLIGAIGNLEVVALYFSVLCVVERDNGKYGRLLAYSALLLASFYVVLGGAKGGLVTITLMVFFLYSFNMPWQVIARRGGIAFIAVLLFFCLGLIFVNFTYDVFSGAGDVANSLFTAVRNYWVGGLIAFDQVVEKPAEFEHFQSISRFFLETANSLGASYYVPSVHADYVPISDTENTNVFTIYYSYYLDGGFLAVFFLSAIYSFVLSFVYLKAKFGDKKYLLMYALLLSGIIFSIVSERFFLGLNGTIKALLFWWGFYYMFSARSAQLPTGSAISK
jgi:oligosaccharide repeat unit polymerase